MSVYLAIVEVLRCCLVPAKVDAELPEQLIVFRMLEHN